MGSNIGGVAELVQDGYNGVLFTPADMRDLCKQAQWLLEHEGEMQQMSRNARLTYEKKYTPITNYGQLMNVYTELVESRRTDLPIFEATTPE